MGVYSRSNLNSDVFLEEVTNLLPLLKSRKMLLLDGPSNVGKTFTALRIAWAMAGSDSAENTRYIKLSSVCDISSIVGRREDNKILPGFVLRALSKANKDGEPVTLVLDDIDKCDMRAVFGSMLHFFKEENRGTVTIADNNINTAVKIPSNIYVIATTTADYDTLDISIKNMFYTVEMVPAFATQGFKMHMQSVNVQKINNIVKIMMQINDYISSSDSIDSKYMIGHGYFCMNNMSNAELKNIVSYRVIPILKHISKWDNGKGIDKFIGQLTLALASA